MGPFNEADVHVKLKGGDLDPTAYVFTEGMSDWTVISDAVVFAKAPAVSAGATETKLSTPEPAAPQAAVHTEKISAAPSSTKVARSVEPTVQQSVKSDAKTEKKKTPASRRVLVYSLLLILVAIAGFFYATDPTMQLPFGLGGGGGEAKINTPKRRETAPEDGAPVPAPQNGTGTAATSAAPATPQAVAVAKDLDWNELREFRKTENPKGAPFRTATQTLAGSRPVIVGVLSPLVKFESVKVAVFPDNEKNLMPVAKVWIMKVPVLDGYFSFGPLNVEGAELPAGEYHVLVASGDSFLGEVGFEIGTWPAADKLAEIQAQIQKERTVLGERERSALEVKFREANAALEQLRLHGRSAASGVKGAKEWKRVSKPWATSMVSALEDQRTVMGGPMFYPDVQGKLHDFMFRTYQMYGALDLYSRGGAKALAKERKKSLGQLWQELDGTQSALAGEIQILGQKGVTNLRIDSEIIKAQLLEMK